jgi:hypothetical protein
LLLPQDMPPWQAAAILPSNCHSGIVAPGSGSSALLAANGPRTLKHIGSLASTQIRQILWPRFFGNVLDRKAS